MQAYMFSTLQSITSYAMLLERLLKNLDERHLAYKRTATLHTQMVDFNKSIDVAKGNYDKLSNLQALMPDFPINLAKENRKLLRHEKLQAVSFSPGPVSYDGTDGEDNSLERSLGAADLDSVASGTCPVALILLSDMCIVCNYQEVLLPQVCVLLPVVYHCLCSS